ncbi:MAG: FapA family protein [Bacteroidales bacterium]|nr:FapA family protein [Bacteroidales bacterium]MCM1415332.1 FapA family protein [bacterium]MCM1424027.1 FapA family protein [bacterium]
MGLFRQTEKGKEKEKKKTMFLTPEERYPSGEKNSRLSSKEERDGQDYSSEKTLHGNPIIINGTDYLMRMGETRMEALLTVYRRFSMQELQGVLKENGIVYGIREKALGEIAEGKQNYEEVLIATGTAAKDGRDGYFEYHFNTHPETEPIILPDGSVDYNVLGKIELVREGEVLVTYHPPVPAVYGKDICGNEIPAYEGKGLPPLQCKRCSLDETGSKYYADTEGNVTFDGRTLTVTPIYVLDGNLDAATGSLDFHGDVLIQGNVFAGVTVKTTGSITINGHVETAHLFAGKDVILKNGMQGSGNGVIRAGQNVLARFIEQTQVQAGMEVNTGALLNCEVEAGRNVKVVGNRGTIIGGRTTAVEEITAASIGNRAGVETQLVIGLDCEFKAKMSEIDRLTEEYEENMKDAVRSLDRIDYQMKSNRITPELNEQKAEQMRRKISYQLKLKEITQKREDLIDINRRSADGKIVVSGLSNVGCVIVINGVRESLHSEYRDVSYTKGRQEIRILSNKQ